MGKRHLFFFITLYPIANRYSHNQLLNDSNVIPIWVSFLIAIAIILVLSQIGLKDLGTALFAGAIFLALMSPFPYRVNLGEASKLVLLDPKNVFLALSVMVIPLLGGIMNKSGIMMELIHRLDVSNKWSLMLSPGLFGLLPMPGGALLSAPLVENIDPNLAPHKKVAINVWFRHVLILIYPLQGSILVVTDIVGFSNPYITSGILLIPFVVMVTIGFLYLILTTPKIERKNTRNLWIFLRDVIPILLAPIIDIIGRIVLKLLENNGTPAPDWIVPEMFLFFGLIISVILSFFLSNNVKSKEVTQVHSNEIFGIAKKMKVWRYPVMIFGMFFFLEVFISSGMPEFISALNAPMYLFLFISFFLGVATGRVQLPASILFPVYMIQHALTLMPFFHFGLIYFAIFLGYLITPIHPCLAYSIDYFKTTYPKSFRNIVIPALIGLAVVYAVFGVSLLF